MSTLNHAIDLDPATIAHADAADKADRTLQPREILIPVVDAETGAVTGYRAQAIISESYHSPVNLFALDGVSLDRNASLQAEINGWAGTDAMYPQGDEEYMARPADNGAPRWTTLANMLNSISNWSTILSGIFSFLSLNDTPDSYSGQAGKPLFVKSDETGIEFGAAGETSDTIYVLSRESDGGVDRFKVQKGLLVKQ